MTHLFVSDDAASAEHSSPGRGCGLIVFTARPDLPEGPGLSNKAILVPPASVLEAVRGNDALGVRLKPV